MFPTIYPNSTMIADAEMYKLPEFLPKGNGGTQLHENVHWKLQLSVDYQSNCQIRSFESHGQSLFRKPNGTLLSLSDHKNLWSIHAAESHFVSLATVKVFDEFCVVKPKHWPGKSSLSRLLRQHTALHIKLLADTISVAFRTLYSAQRLIQSFRLEVGELIVAPRFSPSAWSVLI